MKKRKELLTIPPKGIVKLYYNTHLKILSVMQKGKVIGYVPGMELKNVEFLVRPTGRQRTIEEGQKNVHAFAVGESVSLIETLSDIPSLKQVRYNPYLLPYFHLEDLSPVYKAPRAFILKNHCWITNE